MAQRCNSDVLIEVFSHLDHVTLSTAARVCRSWQPAATNRLYHDIRLDTRKPSTRTLVDTLTAQPALRGLVRRVTLNHPPLRKLDLSLINWLALLPSHSLQSVVLEQGIFTLPETGPLIDFPAIRTVPCMLACGMLSVEGLTKILNMPHLETLAIYIDSNVKTLATKVLPPKLRRLAIGSFGYTLVVQQLLESCDTPLEQFVLVADELEEDDLISLKKGLRNHAPLLKRLSFVGHPFFESAFMDDYVLSFTSMETLLCPKVHTLRYSCPRYLAIYHRSSCELHLRGRSPVMITPRRSSSIGTSWVPCPSSSFWIPTTVGSSVDRLQKCVRGRISRFERWTTISSILFSPAPSCNIVSGSDVIDLFSPAKRCYVDTACWVSLERLADNNLINGLLTGTRPGRQQKAGELVRRKSARLQMTSSLDFPSC